jgi:uncharacterized protein (TIGR02099 family)
VLPIPSKLLKTWSALTRWLLGVVVMAWLLLGLTWGALHWWIVPRIDEFRPQLEAQATRALGLPVRIGAISAQSNGMLPSFELSRVSLLDAQGREALSLPRVLVSVSPRSFWRLGFEQVYIDAPNLAVRRLVDGRITIAGLATAGDGVDTAALDWFFSQIEFVVHDGTVQWSDEQRGVAPVVLKGVKAVARNFGRHHDVRLDATPPPAWGERFSLQAQFLQPLLSRQNGRWESWDGQVYAASDHIDLSELRRYVDLGVRINQGRGAVRAWVDVSRGRVTGALADLALAEVNVTLGQDLPPLALQRVQGRVGGRQLVGGFEVTSQALAFDTQDGLRWPGGNVHVLFMEGGGGVLPRGELSADQVDLAALAQVLQRFPVAVTLREQLLAYKPRGAVEKLALTWQGSPNDLQKYSAKGRLSQLEVDAVAPVPGVRGLSVDFDLNQQSGRASLLLTQGSVDAPWIFQDGLVDVTRLSADARWQVSAERLAVAFSDVNFVNPDAQGQAQVKWESSDASRSATRSRFPGVLDVQAMLSRADGAKVHRYLPLVIDQDARDYVRDAVKAGMATNVRFAIKGEISDMPAVDPSKGIFKISADVRDATLAIVPRTLQEPQELPWPTLTELAGQLVIDGMQLQVKDARARVGESSNLKVVKADVSIADLDASEVKVVAALKGSLPETLRVVNSSPIGALIDGALRDTATTGDADITLKLGLPLANLDKSTVQGSVTLAGNDVQITPDSPKLTRARGLIGFSESGLSLAGVQAHMLGGDARLEGGLVLAPGAMVTPATPALIRANGTASAEGLRQANELGAMVTALAHHASGSATYTAALGFRHGVMELLVQSNLQGMALNLPEPVQKGAATPMALRVQTEWLSGTAGITSPAGPLSDRLSVSLGQLGRVVYERDVSGLVPMVRRGSIGVGLDAQEAFPWPSQGVSANVKVAQLNVDAWQAALPQATCGLGTAGTEPLGGAAASQGKTYLPNAVALRAEVLTVGGRQFHQVVMTGGREGAVWRAKVDAQELNGQLEYRQGADGVAASSAGRLYARLTRLAMAPAVATDVEALLDAQPASIPALDIVVDDFELGGKRFGRLEVEATNRVARAQDIDAGVREWRLNKFNLSVPEATLTASGNWTRLNAQSAAAGGFIGPVPDRRRTVLNFKLDIADGGALLARFGMKDVVRRASGKMEGQVAWFGSPLKLDYPSLGGAFTVNVASGQFLKADPGIAKLFGVLSLQALPRRLTLDFRDVFSEGFAFDFLRGDVTVERGMARTNNLQMKGVNAAVLMEGQADIAQETQDLNVVVVPEINAGTASLLASVINPAVGLGTFLAEVFLRRPLIESATQQFHVTGSWADPQVAKVTKVPRTQVQIKEGSP